MNAIADTDIKQAVLLSGKTSNEVVLERAKEKIKPSEEKLEEIIIMKKNGNEFSFGWEDPWVAYYTYNWTGGSKSLNARYDKLTNQNPYGY